LRHKVEVAGSLKQTMDPLWKGLGISILLTYLAWDRFHSIKKAEVKEYLPVMLTEWSNLYVNTDLPEEDLKQLRNWGLKHW
jgi:hypothetical protein